MSAASCFVQADDFGNVCSTQVIALLLDAGANAHHRVEEERIQLMVRLNQNIQYW
jgi:hypothetical protein